MLGRRSSEPSPQVHRLTTVSVVLLFLTSAAFGVLEIHFSTDTWINLAAGRHILSSPWFPTEDVFSYTARGNTWLNQNWLTQVVQFSIYDNFGASALVWAGWLLAASIFVWSLLAARFRSGSWWVACFTGAIVALGCRDFVSARAATTGYSCAAAQWALLCALHSQGRSRRWWPILLLGIVQLLWTMAHGSFLLGYGVLSLYLSLWGMSKLSAFKPLRALARVPGLFPSALSSGQALTLGAVMIGTFLMSGLLGPFHWDNYFHFERIAGSPLWRTVYEWKPVPLPFEPGFAQKLTGGFPPMTRFYWLASAILLFGAVVAIARFRTSTAAAGEAHPPIGARPPAGHPRSIGVIDVAMVVLGLVMTLKARRFAPFFYIYTAPLLALWIVRASLLCSPSVLGRLRRAVPVAALLAAGLIGIVTVRWAERDHSDISRRAPGLDLLEMVTRCDLVPHEAVDYLVRNELSTHLLCSWANAGLILFAAPSNRVFIDGRAQALYEEEIFRTYTDLMVQESATLEECEAALDGESIPDVSGSRAVTDAVLLTRDAAGQYVMEVLMTSSRWTLATASVNYALFFRTGSPAFSRIVEQDRQAREWRPSTPFALACLGIVRWDAGDGQRALDCWLPAVNAAFWVGEVCFEDIVRAFLVLNRKTDGETFLRQQRDVLRSRGGEVPPVVLRRVEAALGRAEALLAGS